MTPNTDATKQPVPLPGQKYLRNQSARKRLVGINRGIDRAENHINLHAIGVTHHIRRYGRVMRIANCLHRRLVQQRVATGSYHRDVGNRAVLEIKTHPRNAKLMRHGGG